MVSLHIGDDVSQIQSDKSLSEAEKRKELMALFNKAEQENDECPTMMSTRSMFPETSCKESSYSLDADIQEDRCEDESVAPHVHFSCVPEYFERRRGPKGVVERSDHSLSDEQDLDEYDEMPEQMMSEEAEPTQQDAAPAPKPEPKLTEPAPQPAQPTPTPTQTPTQQSTAAPKQRRRFIKPIYVLAALGVVIVAYLAISYGVHKENPQLVTTSIQGDNTNIQCKLADPTSYVSITNTEVGGEEFVIMEPRNATPELAVGYDNVNGADVVAIFEAAGIRGDVNEHGEHGIVGAFVCKGELLSRGMSKLGFCAIIDGEITLGVADNTPLFEKCVETEGYFFRQYPLIASGEAVDVKAPGSYLRKALAELNGKIVVIQSKEKMTFGDFSEALKAMGVTTAIYLNGGNSISKCLNQDGTYTVLGNPSPVTDKNVNYIVWRR